MEIGMNNVWWKQMFLWENPLLHEYFIRIVEVNPNQSSIYSLNYVKLFYLLRCMTFCTMAQVIIIKGNNTFCTSFNTCFKNKTFVAKLITFLPLIQFLTWNFKIKHISLLSLNRRRNIKYLFFDRVTFLN